MDKTLESSSASESANSSDRNNYLRNLNKLSHKISKPILNRKPSFDSTTQPQPPPPPPQNDPLPPQPQQNLQHQPPVYNINKNDFRDVVQKLTGSPAHERISTPPPIQNPKPQSSRLQRIRPPPLPNITIRPPSLLNNRPQFPPQQNFNFNPVNNFNQNLNFPGFGRTPAPLSPLPPFPTVHAPAESPISAYMRNLQNFDYKNFPGFSPLPAPPPSFPPPPPPVEQPQPQAEQQTAPPQPLPQPPPQPPQQQEAQSQSQFQMPTSPGPFGCLNSQLASYPLFSPGLLFSPNSGNLGFPQLPLSPTVPVPSPRWSDI